MLLYYTNLLKADINWCNLFLKLLFFVQISEIRGKNKLIRLP